MRVDGLPAHPSACGDRWPDQPRILSLPSAATPSLGFIEAGIGASKVASATTQPCRV
jgi:hypothetical protein